MRSEDCISSFQPRAAFDPHGWLWVRTLRGLSAVAPPEDVLVPQATPIIDELRVRGAIQNTGVDVVQGTAGDPVEFRFTAPSFLDPRDLKFSYRLAGLDENFIDAGAGRAAVYAALPPGRFTFELRCETNARYPSLEPSQTQVTVNIAPPYHATVWFRSLVVLAIGFIAFALYRARLARLRMRYALVEQERARIARDLHDDLAQGFLAVSLMLDGLKTRLGRLENLPSTITRILDDARSALVETRDNARRAIWNIRAESASRPSLAKLLETQVAQVRRETKSDVTLNLCGPPTPRSAILEYELPRIMKEALTNAIRHGKATKVDVQLIHNDQGLSLSITDNGQGLTPSGTTGGGVGVVGMGERAGQLGGQLTVRNAAQHTGVEVLFTMPAPALRALEEKPQ
jgi:signal transduction histidine kinase